MGRRASLSRRLIRETLGGSTVTTISVGVPWLSPRDWPKWAQIDPEILPYGVWRAKADDAIVELRSRGVAPRAD